MTFKPRTAPPSVKSKYWIHTSAGGVNSCIHIKGGSVLPNCVGYAWGRAYELIGKAPKLSRRNAEDWYGYTSDGYKRGAAPKLGAIACWRKGKAGNNSDGAGHVAVVEHVYTDGSIDISESGYNSFRFRNRKLSKPYSIGSAYTFQGFIYLPISSDDEDYDAYDTFVRGVQECIDAAVDGIPGPETISKTITVSETINNKHDIVAVIQTYLNDIGYNCGNVDKIAGPLFTEAVKAFQAANGCVVDGIITAGAKTWRKLLGME